MNIKDWVYDNVSVFYDGLSIEDDEGMYAVGTCGRCRYWGGEDYEEYATSNCNIPNDINEMELLTEKDFGCIHWEGKLEHT